MRLLANQQPGHDVAMLDDARMTMSIRCFNPRSPILGISSDELEADGSTKRCN